MSGRPIDIYLFKVVYPVSCMYRDEVIASFNSFPTRVLYSSIEYVLFVLVHHLPDWIHRVSYRIKVKEEKVSDPYSDLVSFRRNKGVYL